MKTAARTSILFSALLLGCGRVEDSGANDASVDASADASAESSAPDDTLRDADPTADWSLPAYDTAPPPPPPLPTCACAPGSTRISLNMPGGAVAFDDPPAELTGGCRHDGPVLRLFVHRSTITSTLRARSAAAGSLVLRDDGAGAWWIDGAGTRRDLADVTITYATPPTSTSFGETVDGTFSTSLAGSTLTGTFRVCYNEHATTL